VREIAKTRKTRKIKTKSREVGEGKTSEKTSLGRLRLLEKVLPPPSKLVNLQTLEDYVAGLDIQGLERLIGSQIRKVKTGLYAVSTSSSGRVNPSLVYLAVRYGLCYAYLSMVIGRSIFTRGQLKLIALGEAMHRAYGTALRRVLKNGVVLQEVEVEGNIHGLDMRGRIDILLSLPEKLKIGKNTVIAYGGRLAILEVKSSDMDRSLKAGLAQACIYREMLRTTAVTLAVGRTRIVDGGFSWEEIEKIVKLLATLREPPPRSIDPYRSDIFCRKYCPYRQLKLCELAR